MEEETEAQKNTYIALSMVITVTFIIVKVA